MTNETIEATMPTVSPAPDHAASEQNRTAFNQIKHPKRRRMLFAIAAVGESGIAAAARLANIRRQNHHDWLHRDPVYAAAVEEARRLCSDRIEREINAEYAERRRQDELAEKAEEESHVQAVIARHAQRRASRRPPEPPTSTIALPPTPPEPAPVTTGSVPANETDLYPETTQPADAGAFTGIAGESSIP